MIGAGVFVVFAPAAAAAGSGLLIGLGIAAAIAYCNADSSARLAVRYPQSGGTYVYGRERLGAFWGYLAGWSFVVGKTASCAAMALTAGVYLWPNHAHAVAAAAVVALAAVNYRGIEKSARATRLIVAAVLAVLASVVVTVASSGRADPSMITFSGGDADGVLQAAGLLFFAFAGYARIATLGEEVCDPRRTIGRAIRISLAATLTLYAVLAVTLLSILGPGLASATAPLADAVRAAGASGLEPVVRGAAAAAALGALLSLLLGVSRTVLAMSRDGYLPGALAAVHPRFAVPHRAEITLAAVVAVLAAVTDLRAAIGFSSFAVLVYYAIANAAAATLGRRLVPAAGLLGCVLLAVFLPPGAALAGAAVVGAGALSYPLVRKR
jgi:APA family basic amino acid/polyamine antiporter